MTSTDSVWTRCRQKAAGTAWRPCLGDWSVVFSALACLATLALNSSAGTFTVTSTSNAGAGSLREALTLANAQAGLDTVVFAIPGATPSIVRVTTQLPQVASPLLIDGYSQPGALPATSDSPATLTVQIQGEPSFSGFAIASGECTIRGCAIVGFSRGISVSGADAVSIQGNHIGVDAAGTSSLSNGTGIRLQSAGHTIGGSVPAARNVISGNGQSGIEIDTGAWGSEPGIGSRIEGNFIGTDASGILPLGNGDCGIAVIRSADNMIGGEATPAGNTIAYNGSSGVFVAHGIRNGILSNAVFDNGGLGIDLLWDYWDSDPDGVNPNDNGDGDWGANELQNFPVLTGAEVQGSSVRVSGTLNSLPMTSFRIEFYAVPTPDGSGHGEGTAFVGATQTVTDADGMCSFTVTVPLEIASGWFLSSTATDPLNNTSEFGPCIPFQSSTRVTTILDEGPGSLRNALVTANLTAGVDTITFAIPGEGPHVIQVTSSLPPIQEAVIIDGYAQTGASEATASTPAVVMVELDGSMLSGDESGLTLTAGGSTVRGLAVGGFPWCGILIEFTDSLTITGNHLGVDAAGMNPRGNGVGLMIDGGQGTIVGGSLPASRNVISGNVLAGMVLAGTADSALGNYVGTSATGTAIVGNGIGVVLGGDEVLGGATPPARNVIAGNSSHGVVIAFSRNTVSQNWIGMTADSLVVGNGGVGVGVGIEWLDAAVQTQFSLTGGPGYAVENSLRGNVICGSGGLGIDHFPVGPAVNDAYDVDGGNNYQQNYPVLTETYDVEGQTTLMGTLVSTPNTSFAIDFYLNELPDPTNYGEGFILLGTRPAITDAGGAATVWIQVPTGSVHDRFVCCTATDPQGNTSEFGPCLAVGGTGVVTSVADSGQGSLRRAMAWANASNMTTVVTFSIPGVGPHVIRPSSPLPPVIKALTINGYSQPGASPAAATSPAALMIELDGTSAGEGADGISIQGDGAVVSGLMVTGFSGHGVRVSGDGNTVQGMWIGVANGGSSLGNNEAGIMIEGSGNTIGGTVASSRNIISGNGGNGIRVAGEATVNNTIMGNYVGTDPDGVEVWPNEGAGVRIECEGNTVGNGQPSGRNLISGNGGEGVLIEGNDNHVRGNFIGVDVTGSGALGNGSHGVSISFANNNTIGGETQGDRNVISSNGGAGVRVSYIGSGDNALLRNLIGIGADGQTAVGNAAAGVSIRGALNTLIGGAYPEQGNVIAYNGGDGVEVVTGMGNAILCNAIFENDELGVDLGSTGITPNDTGDSDTGANMLQNYPELTTAAADSAGALSVRGSLSSTADGAFVLRFFWSTEADESGYGEGANWVGEHLVSTGQGGQVQFTTTLVMATVPSAGAVLSATATSSSGNTSEFCAAIPISGLPVQGSPTAVTFDLRQNSPNPFAGITEIPFSVPSSGDVNLSIYDLNGHLVRRLISRPLLAGLHTALWDGAGTAGMPVAPGTYVCRLKAGDRSKTTRVVVLR